MGRNDSSPDIAALFSRLRAFSPANSTQTAYLARFYHSGSAETAATLPEDTTTFVEREQHIADSEDDDSYTEEYHPAFYEALYAVSGAEQELAEDIDRSSTPSDLSDETASTEESSSEDGSMEDVTATGCEEAVTPEDTLEQAAAEANQERESVESVEGPQEPMIRAFCDLEIKAPRPRYLIPVLGKGVRELLEAEVAARNVIDFSRANTGETVSVEAKHVYRETLTIKYHGAAQSNTTHGCVGGAQSDIEAAWNRTANWNLRPSFDFASLDNDNEILEDIAARLPPYPTGNVPSRIERTFHETENVILKASMDFDDDCDMEDVFAQIPLCNTAGEYAGGVWRRIEEAWHWTENRTLQPTLGSVALDDGSEVLEEIREMLPLCPTAGVLSREQEVWYMEYNVIVPSALDPAALYDDDDLLDHIPAQLEDFVD